MLHTARPRRSPVAAHPQAIPIERGARRRDVQALRGLAVLVVVVYHTGIGFPGGFVGVDVFFVVSGFVITALLLRELAATDRIRLREFYARRARRLFPVLGLVLTVSLLGAAALLPVTGDLQQASSTATAGALFGANAYLYGYGGGYFTPDTENPFLHLWSLAVEEQTYLILPAVLMLLWWVGNRWWDPRRSVAVGVSALSIASLWCSIVWSSGDGLFGVPLAERFAFYGPVSRFWEFGAGILLALAVPLLESSRRVVRAAPLLGAAGLGLIALSVLGFEATMQFPGWVAAVPVAGTTLVLAAGTSSLRWRHGVSWRSMVWLGDHSYGWYLWHWPAIVLAAAWWPGRRDIAVVAAGAALAIAVLASQRLENRYRHDLAIVGRRAVAVSAVSLLVPAAVGVAVGSAAERGWWRADIGVAVAAQEPTRADAAACNSTVRTSACEFDPPSGVAGGAGMAVGGVDDAPRALLVGDSHAGALADAFVAAAHANGMRAAVWTRGNCAPLIGPTVRGPAPCDEWVDGLVRWIADTDVDVVVVHTSRAYAEPGRLRTATGARTTTAAQGLQAYADGLRGFASAAARAGAETLVVTGVPTFRGSEIEHTSLVRPDPQPRSMEIGDFLSAVGPIDDALHRLADSEPHVSVVDVWPAVCGVHDCTQRDDEGVWRYRDWHHLTLAGAALTEPALTEALRRLR